MARVQDIKRTGGNNTTAVDGITSILQGSPSAVKHCQSCSRYGYPMMKWYRPVFWEKTDICIRWAKHAIGVTVSTACTVCIERHHVKKERGRIAPCYGSGEKVHLTDYSIPFGKQGDELIGVTFTSQAGGEE